MFDLTPAEMKVFKRLSTPIKIQDYLDRLPVNYEKKGETYMSPRRVLKAKKMHCMEGALFAAAALWLNGQKPLLMDLKIKPIGGKLAEDHVVTLYKKNGYWGAISKTNHATLRFRDPVYKTLRELALSYFHEYFVDKKGNKVLRSFSQPFDLTNFGVGKIVKGKAGTKIKKQKGWWITAEEDLYDIVQALDDSRHVSIFPIKNAKHIRRADRMERMAGELRQWKKTSRRT